MRRTLEFLARSHSALQAREGPRCLAEAAAVKVTLTKAPVLQFLIIVMKLPARVHRGSEWMDDWLAFCEESLFRISE